jgi:hypothetical protein
VKILLFHFLVFLFFTHSSSAQKKSDASDLVSVSVTTENDTVTYNFATIKNLEENLDPLLNEIITNSDEKVLPTITVKVKIILPEITTTVITSTTGPRTTMVTTIKKICFLLLKGISE